MLQKLHLPGRTLYRFLQGSGRAKPINLEGIVLELEKAVPDLARVHYLRYSLAMDEQDHVTAIEALQRYFDYSHGILTPMIELHSPCQAFLAL